MDAYITLMERLMTILMQHHVKNVRSQQCRKTAHGTGGQEESLHRLLRELAEVTAEPLSIIFVRPWILGEVPEDWRIANVSLVFKKGKKEDVGNSRPVSLTSVPRKVREQPIVGAISKQLE